MNICVIAIRFRRGQSYVALQCEDALRKAGHAVSIYSRAGTVQGKNVYDDTAEFANNETTVNAYSPSYEIDETKFRNFLIENKIDCVLFIEEQYQKGLGNICRELGVKSANIIMWEFFDPTDREKYNQFDLLISPIEAGHLHMEAYGYNSCHVKWGIDSSIWNKNKRDRTDGIRRFVHCAGWGGIYNRKQTEFVVDAFSAIKDKKGARLLVHQQSTNITDKVDKRNVEGGITVLTGNVSRENIIGFYQWSDVALAPSLWEGIGLSLLEPQMIGLPVVTVNDPPMAEWVTDYGNGRLIDVQDREPFEGIKVLGSYGSRKHFIEIMEYYIDMSDEDIKKKSEKIKDNAIENFNWDKNSKTLIRALEGLVKGVTV